MQKIIVANLKNIMSKNEAKIYSEKLNISSKFKTIICPSLMYLDYFNKNDYYLGVQNIGISNDLCTGEITARQLKDFYVDYVIIGHAERRYNLIETNDIINEKVLYALDNNLKVIFCVGETNINDSDIIIKQLKNGLSGVTDISNIIIAYEPVYMINNKGKVNISKISGIIDIIRQELLKKYGKTTSIIYGGSVTNDNIYDILSVADGVMIGKLSFSYETMNKI